MTNYKLPFPTLIEGKDVKHVQKVEIFFLWTATLISVKIHKKSDKGANY